MQYEAHELANVFPLMDDAAFAELKQDIEAHGLIEPIVLFEGRILDGRNRYRACREAGAEPKFKDFDGSDPVSYVVSLNLKRRHLNETQRAMVAAKLANMPRGGDRPSPKDPNFESANFPNHFVSQSAAAEMLNRDGNGRHKKPRSSPRLPGFFWCN
jgi:hypothetical protein